jgi:hypothetical protein
MIEERLPFGPGTAQCFMKIEDNPQSAKANHCSLLPPSWRALRTQQDQRRGDFCASFGSSGQQGELAPPDSGEAFLGFPASRGREAPRHENASVSPARPWRVNDFLTKVFLPFVRGADMTSTSPANA